MIVAESQDDNYFSDHGLCWTFLTIRLKYLSFIEETGNTAAKKKQKIVIIKLMIRILNNV